MPFIGPCITAIGSPHLSSINTGLGNVLFQIASCYGLSKRSGKAIDYRRVKQLSELLKTRFGFDHGQTIFRLCQQVSSEPYAVYSDKTHNCLNEPLLHFIQTTPHSALIDGYLEYPPYFHAYRDEIVHLFSPDETSSRRIRDRVPELMDEERIPVSIHLRLQHDANTHTPLSYYHNAVSYILERVPTATFLVFSDGDPGDLGFPYKRVRLHYDYEELWAMSMCKHNIISSSTFSWWGAYLNTTPNKIVLNPRHAVAYMCSRNGVDADHLQKTFFLDSVCIP